ncbi:MAG: hypothetical protein AAGI63_12320 [Planctomycetota bacterium]
MTNPYETPVDTTTDFSGVSQLKRIGIEFQSDWSPVGLRQRRKRHWHRMLDVAYAAFCLLWVVSLFLASGNPYAGLFCLLTPIWVLLSVSWFSNLTFRNGESFHRKYAGLAGPVQGKVDNGIVVVRGKDVSFASSVRSCPQCDVTNSYATIMPPGFHSSLPIIGGDIKKHWLINASHQLISRPDLLDQLVGESKAICAEGILRGNDLKSLSIWKQWMWTARVMGLGGTLAIAAALIQVLWMDSSPGLVVLAAVMGAGLLIVGCSKWSKTWRHVGVGSYSVCIAKEAVSIASHYIAFSYYGESLQHFRWTEAGLIVRDSGRQILFAIPAHWFDTESQQQLQIWYGRGTRPPRRTRYLGPKI